MCFCVCGEKVVIRSYKTSPPWRFSKFRNQAKSTCRNLRLRGCWGFQFTFIVAISDWVDFVWIAVIKMNKWLPYMTTISVRLFHDQNVYYSTCGGCFGSKTELYFESFVPNQNSRQVPSWFNCTWFGLKQIFTYWYLNYCWRTHFNWVLATLSVRIISVRYHQLKRKQDFKY